MRPPEFGEPFRGAQRRAVKLACGILVIVLCAGAGAVMSCYPRPPVNPPSCAQDPTQPWCVPPPFATRCTTFRVDINADAGVKDDAGVWHYPSRATATPCPDGGTRP